MELVVGVNTYMTLAEAEELIANTFTSTNNKRVYWNTLADDDKKIFIVNSTKKIDKDSMLFKGYKVNKNQEMQFPRKGVFNFGDIVECPNDIKVAVCISMLCDITAESNDLSKIASLGIESYKESDGASVTFNSTVFNKDTNKVCGIDKELFRDYIARYSYICA